MNPPDVLKVHIMRNAEFELLQTGAFFDFDNFKVVLIIFIYSIRPEIYP